MQQDEFDCKEERKRNIYQTYHAENMRQGRIVNTMEIPDKIWVPIAPGTLNEALWKVACGK